MQADRGARALIALWPDGTTTSAQTWEGLEAAMRGGWNPSDPAEFRTEMVQRAGLWSQASVP